MELTDDALKVLIDTVQLRLDDELDALGEDLDVKLVMDRREEVKEIWVLKDLLSDLRRESRDRLRRGIEAGINVTVERGTPVDLNQEPGVIQTSEDLRLRTQQHGPFVTTADARDVLQRLTNLEREWTGLKRSEGELSEGYEGLAQDFSDVRRELNRTQATLGDVRAALTDSAQGSDERIRGLHLRVGALEKASGSRRDGRLSEDERDERFNARFWGRLQNFEAAVGVSLRTVLRRLAEVEELVKAHVGEGEVKH